MYSTNTNICRVCLIDEGNMIVRNIDYFEEIYEKVTNVKLTQNDWPVTICYICLRLLQKCYLFIQTAQKVNQMLSHCGYSETKVKQYKEFRKRHCLHKFSIKNCENIDIICPKLNTDDHLQITDTKDFTNCVDNKFVMEFSPLGLEDTIHHESLENNNFNVYHEEDQIASHIDDKNKELQVKQIVRPKRKCKNQGTPSKKLKMKDIKTEVQHSKIFKNTKNTKLKETVQHQFHKKTNIDMNNKKNTLVTCDNCQYKCNGKMALFRHMKYHDHNRKIVCELCQYRFKKMLDLKRHECSHKMDTTKTDIDTKINDFKSHIYQDQEDTNKLFSCVKCEFNCKEKKDLTKHMKTHGREKYKPFLCHFCDFKCTEKRGLSYHIRTHTGEKPFSCKLCIYSCSTKGSLDRHMKVHTGEKPFSCSVCEYKCAESDSLKKHMRTHTGEKPFSCHICEFKCKVKSNLNVHLKFHTGEKPFSCEMCGYKCTQSSALKMHVVRMHRDKKQPQ